MIDSTSILLKRLDNRDLALEPTQKVPVVPATKPSTKQAEAKAAKHNERVELEPEPGERDSGGGFDPYNSRR